MCLPTGYGKNFCYQTLPFLKDYKNVSKTSNSAVVVISPLITLMTDQVNGIRKCEVKASVITASASVPKEMIATEKKPGF